MTVTNLIALDTGAKARALRASLLDSIGKDDVADVVTAIKEQAKGGNLRAAELFLRLLGAEL